ncbi:MAG TPA: hypothetical protein VE783_09595 [Candidatus Limnocylindrales bacterium]|nr:hypothetical protein [Candidatus Limnocylindrales bacterium]
MQKRSSFRTKVVLPLTLILKNGTQKQAAHTLDLTSDSARIGGLYLPVTPGETIELQRGAARAKFFVFWVGAPGTMMAGQIGTKTLLAGRSIWGVELPEDRPDLVRDVRTLRSGLPLVQSAGDEAQIRQMQATASIRAEGYGHTVFAQVLELSPTCAIVETTAVLPTDTSVVVKLNLGHQSFEVAGVVQVSDPDWGMGIQFQSLSTYTQEKIAQARKALQEPGLVVAEHKPKVADRGLYW